MNLREHLKRRSRKSARSIVDEIGDRETCLNCGENTYVEVHHIDGDWLNNHPMNLAPLCYPCHKRIHQMDRTANRLEEMRDDFEKLTA